MEKKKIKTYDMIQQSHCWACTLRKLQLEKIHAP